MPNIDQLEQTVNNLNGGSPPNAFFDAFDDYTTVFKASQNSSGQRLKNILVTFRQKLQLIDLPHLDEIREKARKLHEILVSMSVGEIIQGINNRNFTLTTLTNELKVEIRKGNADSIKLEQIRNAVENATATIDQLTALVSKLTATNANIKSRLTALIEAAGNISDIFS